MLSSARRIARLRASINRQATELDGLRNLLCSLNMPLLHLTRDLRLQYFTDSAMSAFGVRPSDLGTRPSLCCPAVGDAVLIADLTEVSRTGRPRTRSAASPDGAAGLCRILPLVSADGVQRGVIMVLVPVPVPVRETSSPPVADAPVPGEALTPRQQQIMDMVLAGHPSKNIAADLGISQRTVENHRAAIMQRTGATSLPALARIAIGAAGYADHRLRPARDMLPDLRA